MQRTTNAFAALAVADDISQHCFSPAALTTAVAGA
jgi:hypothetical protein